jgi:predicted lipoprotein with Yx(FWY)xxD motif
MTRTILAAALALMAFPALAETGIMEADSPMGKILTDANGMTLYIFDKDEGGMSACYDKCAVNWPPLLAAEGAMAEGAFGLTTRTDGTMQWTYDGMPLYLWIKDAKPGDTTGDGVNEVWHVAKAK